MAENQIWSLYSSFLGFESVFIQFLTPKNIGKESKILKIGSIEAEITNFVKFWLFSQNRQIYLYFTENMLIMGKTYIKNNKQYIKTYCHLNFQTCIKYDKFNANWLKQCKYYHIKPQSFIKQPMSLWLQF